MKKSILLLFAASVFVANLFAQAQDCDGQRYLKDVFTQTTKSTVTYGMNTSPNGFQTTLKMDIYQPVGDNLSARPLLILAHGGSFITGARGDMAAACTFFAKKGFVTATIDYRLWSFLLGGFPDSLDIMDVVVKAVGDMRASVRYFREDAAGANVYKIDPTRILVGGYSAGAVAAMHTAQMSQDDALPTFVTEAINANGGWEGTTGSATNLAQSSEVHAVVSLSGGLYNPQWLTATDKPFISYHGVLDDVVFYNFGIAAGIMSLHGSGNLHPVADNTGLKNYLHTVPTGDHSNIHFDAGFQADRDIFYTNGCQFLIDNVLCKPLETEGPTRVSGNISAFPNPSSGEMNLVFNDELERSVEIADIMGRLVFRAENVRNSLIINRKDIGNLSGVYFVKTTAQGASARQARIVFE